MLQWLLRAVVLVAVVTAQQLSTPTPSDKTGARADAIAATAAQIINDQARVFPVGTLRLPFYTGPVATNGSLAQKLQLQEAQRLVSYRTQSPEFIAGLILQNRASFTSMESIARVYDLASAKLEKPMSMDNSDANFGRQRLTIKVMRLRQVRPEESCGRSPFVLTNAQLAQICGSGVTWNSVRARRQLFVEDFADVAQWNDAAQPQKYVPNVIGYFCFNRATEQLLPIEIRFPDTGLTYTPLDSRDEWTLAKMGLDAASVSYHQMQHLVDTHAINTPTRVELMRHLAPQHPVRALLERHMLVDFGIEVVGSSVLFSENTALDQVFGWGAAGCIRFADHQARTLELIKNDFPADVRGRGIDAIPTNRYVEYGAKLYAAIDQFVGRFVGVFYASDQSLCHDFELQSWAAACAQVPQLRGFPSAFKSRAALRRILSHYVFQSAVRHHAMNGIVSWHASTVPYAPPALWKAMPTKKLRAGETLNLLEYTAPISKLHVVAGLFAIFLRPPPISESLPVAYRGSPWKDVDALQPAVADFEKAMGDIDEHIRVQESAEKFPFTALRPTNLPFYTWV
ncbi:hypothetical protein PINS_up012229 [Pythium insidiosum]|nr:hypothetical protein PINS_up012229 [Pythium insidiosum]